MSASPKNKWLVRRHTAAFGLIEVLIAALLITSAMATILAIYLRSARMLRTSRVAAASSQVLQQRLESVRDRPWAKVTSSQAIAALMQSPTNSEGELAAQDVVETLKVIAPLAKPGGLIESERYFLVRRAAGVVTVDVVGDFRTEPTLLFESSITWLDDNRPQSRHLRTVVCRNGLTRSGIVGTILGRPGTQVNTRP